MEIKLGTQWVGRGHPCLIIAEISCNHLQDKARALEMIDAAADAGATAVKFQAYTPDTLTLDPLAMAPSEKDHFTIQGSIWEGRSYYDLYQEAFTPWEWFGDLMARARERGLFFLVTPFDESAVDMLEDLGVDAYKVASFEINHIPLLERIRTTGKPVIFSTGTALLEDIELALETLTFSPDGPVVPRPVILKCTSAYPAPLEEANLATMVDMANRFSTLVGLSDHTTSPVLPAHAVALGACVVEKHFTLEKKGPDAAFSLLPEEFAAMVDHIRQCEAALGKVSYEPSPKVVEHRAFMRSIFVAAPMGAGEVFTRDNIRVVRPGDGMHPRHYGMLLGKRAARDIRAGEPLDWDMVG
ncbi:MAG: pseudaminic acid synthase [Desulfovibrionales bacterium]|nr:pseudaminic acid synthase [Desulfovibrionales bacterium]